MAISYTRTHLAAITDLSGTATDGSFAIDEYWIYGSSTAANSPSEWKFQGSNDGSSWNDLDSQTGISFTALQQKRFTVSSPTAYRYYRLYITNNNGGSYTQINKIKIFVGGVDYSPKMSGNNTPSRYTAAASTEYDNATKAYCVFSYTTDYQWSTTAAGKYPCWISIDLNTPPNGMAASTDYWVCVVALSTMGTYTNCAMSAPSNIVKITTTDTNKTLDLKWSQVSGALGYNVWFTTVDPQDDPVNFMASGAKFISTTINGSGESAYRVSYNLFPSGDTIDGSISIMDDVTTTGVQNIVSYNDTYYYAPIYPHAIPNISISGSTSGDPSTMAKLYTADVAAGWGHITEINTYNKNAYLVKANLGWASGDYFSESSCHIIIFGGRFYMGSGSTTTTVMGSLATSGVDLTFIHSRNAGISTQNIYMGWIAYLRGGTKIKWYCYGYDNGGSRIGLYLGSYYYIKNISVDRLAYGVLNNTPAFGCYIEDVTYTHSGAVLYMNAGVNMSECKFKNINAFSTTGTIYARSNCTIDGFKSYGASSYHIIPIDSVAGEIVKLNLKNSNLDFECKTLPICYWYGSLSEASNGPYSERWVKGTYTVKFVCLDENGNPIPGVTVTCLDNTGTTVFTTTTNTYGVNKICSDDNILDDENSSFEGGTVGRWANGNCTSKVISTDAYSGSKCLEFTATKTTDVRIYQNGATYYYMPSNETYTLGMWVKAGNDGAIGNIYTAGMYGNNSGWTWGNSLTLTSNWQYTSVTKTWNSSDTTRNITLYSGNTNVVGDKMLVDNITLKRTSPTFSSDNSSFEGGTVGNWGDHTARCTTSVATGGKFGNNCLKLTGNDSGYQYVWLDAASVTKPDGVTPYVLSAWIKGEGSTIGKSVRIGMWGTASDWTFNNGNVNTVLTSSWQKMTVRKIFRITDTARQIYPIYQTSAYPVSGDVWYIDGIQLEQDTESTEFNLCQANKDITAYMFNPNTTGNHYNGTMTNYNPFTFIFSKSGYKTVTMKKQVDRALSNGIITITMQPLKELNFSKYSTINFQ